MILSNDGFDAFHYRSYGTFFLHKIGSIISIGDLPTTNIIEPKDADFRRVDYDIEAELQLAKDLQLPYYQVYYESLVNGIHHTHNQDLLHEIAQSQGHDVELDDWLSGNS